MKNSINATIRMGELTEWITLNVANIFAFAIAAINQHFNLFDVAVDIATIVGILTLAWFNVERAYNTHLKNKKEKDGK